MKQQHLNLHFDQFVCIAHSLCVSISLELLSKQHPFNLQSVSFRCLFIFFFILFLYLYLSLFMINTHLICKVSRARYSAKKRKMKKTMTNSILSEQNLWCICSKKKVLHINRTILNHSVRVRANPNNFPMTTFHLRLISLVHRLNLVVKIEKKWRG